MKFSKFFTSSILALFAGIFTVSAQTYTPTESWPYIYKDFTKGTLTPRNAAELVTEFNVPLTGTKLHYVQDGKIMEIPAMRVISVTIGDDLYIAASSRLMKVLASDESGYVLSATEVDIDAMNKVSIGYGISSSTASAQNVTTLTETGDVLVNQNLLDSVEKQGTGKPLKTKTNTFIFVKGQLLEASKSIITKESGVEKKAINAFFKENKIKWIDAESLLKVVDFLASQN